MADDLQQQLAKERTVLAQERTLLAEERTFSAWIRTGLAALATGLAIAQLMSESGPAWLIRSLAAIFIFAGGAMFGLGYWAYRDAVRKLDQVGIRGIPLWIIAGLSLILVIAAITGLGLIVLE
jgi:putative membrane protein